MEAKIHTFKKIVLCTFLAIFSNSIFANVPVKKFTPKIKITTEQILQNKKINFTHREKKINTKFEIFYDQFKKGQPNKKLLTDIIHSSKGRSYLRPIRYWLKDIEYIMASKNIGRTVNHCKKLKARKYIYKRLFKSIKAYCTSNVISLINKNKKSLSKPNIFLFLTQNFDLFLQRSNIKKFGNMLGNLNVDAKTKISNHLTEYHIANNLFVNKKLLESIIVTPKLTRYIQEKGFSDNYVSDSFYKSFRSITTELFELTDKRVTNRIIKEKIYQILNFIDSNKEHLKMNKVEDRLLSVGKSLSRRKYYYEARLLYSPILNSAKPYKIEEIHFENLWTYSEQDKRRAAYKYIMENNLTKNFKQLKNTKLKFWIARSIEQKNKALSIPYYENIVLRDPVSYYGVMSAKEIALLNDTSAPSVYRKLHPNSNSPYLVPKKWAHTFLFDSLKRIKLFGGLNTPSLIKEEIARISETKMIDGHITTALVSKSLMAASKYLDSFKVVYRHLAKDNFVFDIATLKTLFPMPYYKYVKKVTKGFDPLIALSLIRQESGFDPKARSHVGARGLMQLMPKTARQYKKRVKAKSLENPTLNVRIGTTYLKNLLKRYDQNLILALASYNAGEGNVDDWISQEYLRANNAVEAIEQIAFNETRKYVKYIFRNLFFYKLLHEPELMKKTHKNQKIFETYIGFNQVNR